MLSPMGSRSRDEKTVKNGTPEGYHARHGSTLQDNVRGRTPARTHRGSLTAKAHAQTYTREPIKPSVQTVNSLQSLVQSSMMKCPCPNATDSAKRYCIKALLSMISARHDHRATSVFDRFSNSPQSYIVEQSTELT